MIEDQLLTFNQKGSVLLIVMVIVVVTGVSALSSALMVQQIQKVNYQTRVKGLMTSVEANLKLRAQQTYAYIDCNTAIGPSSCRLNHSYFDDIQFMPLGSCSEGDADSQCGIVVEDLSYVTEPSPLIQATIRYTASDLSLAPIYVSIEPPFEILQTEALGNQCSNGLFQGYDSLTGAIVCRAPKTCSEFEIMTDIDHQLNSVCQNLPVKHFPIDGVDEVILTHINYYMEQHRLPDLSGKQFDEIMEIRRVYDYERKRVSQRKVTGGYIPLYPVEWWRQQ